MDALQDELRTVKPGEVRSRELPKLQRRDSLPAQWPSTPLQAAASLADNAKPDAVSSSAVRRSGICFARVVTMLLFHVTCVWSTHSKQQQHRPFVSGMGSTVRRHRGVIDVGTSRLVGL